MAGWLEFAILIKTQSFGFVNNIFFLLTKDSQFSYHYSYRCHLMKLEQTDPAYDLTCSNLAFILHFRQQVLNLEENNVLYQTRNNFKFEET
mgnify:CR=1 FL=1